MTHPSPSASIRFGWRPTTACPTPSCSPWASCRRSNETEPNNEPAAAQAVAAPIVVEGQAAGNDVDHVRFPGTKGQRIVIDAACARIGSGVDPQIRLTTAKGAYVASADDTAGLLTDARLVADLPEDGDYILEISDTRYQGGGRAVYRLTIGAVPLADSVYPLGGRRGETVGFELRGGTLPDGVRTAAATLAAPPDRDDFRPRITAGQLGLTDTSLDVELPGSLAISNHPELREPAGDETPLKAAPPAVLNGRIDPEGDEDRFVVVVTPGRKYRARVEAASLGSALDGQLRALKPDGGEIAQGDDNTLKIVVDDPAKPVDVISPDPSLEFTPPEGVTEVTLALRDLSGRGGVGYAYRLVVEPADPGFDVVLNDAQISVPRGGTAHIPVTVTRRDFGGPITLNVVDPPAGLTVRPGIVAAGQAVGVLSVSAASDAGFGPIELAVVGQADGPGGPLKTKAAKTLVYASQSNLPVNYGEQVGLPAAPAQPEPLTLDAPSDPVEVVHGIGGTVSVKAERKDDSAKVELTLAPLPLPKGVAVPEVKVAPDAASADVAVSVGADASLGRVDLALVARGKIGDKDRAFAVPVVALEIVRPAELTLAAAEVSVKAGETAEVKGTLVRRGSFKEPVTITLSDLPGGVKAEPATVPPDVQEFTIALTADPGAAEATAQTKVTPGFKIGDKDYPTPPTPLSVKVVK